MRQYQQFNNYGSKPSFPWKRWFLFFSLLLLASIVGFVMIITEGQPIEKAKIFINEILDVAIEEIPVAESENNALELEEADKKVVSSIISLLFVENSKFKLQLYSEDEAQKLKNKFPQLLDKKNYFSRLEESYYFVSNDGLRLYRCEVKGELYEARRQRELKIMELHEEAAREATEAAAEAKAASSQKAPAVKGVVTIYSPSSISGNSEDEINNDLKGQGIYRDANGIWKNH